MLASFKIFKGCTPCSTLTKLNFIHIRGLLQYIGNSGGFLGGLDGHGHLLYSVFKSSINEELMKSGMFITDTRTHFFHSSSDKWVYQSNG